MKHEVKVTTINEVAFVTIPKKEYDDLLDKEFWLSCLEGAGVDNWEGYDYACEMYREGI